MVKKFVLSGYFGFKNFGDEAILSVLVSKLKQENHKITVISSDPEFTKSQYKNIKSVYTFNMSEIIAQIAKSDILISGGGSLLQDVTSLKSLIYYLSVIFIALFLRKKVIIFAQGIGPIKNHFGQFVTKTLLSHCTYVSVRDEKSLELMNKWGINAELLCDPIFSTQIAPVQKNRTVGIQLRNFRTMSDDFIDRLAQKVCQEFADYELEIYSFQDSIDLEVCEKFQKAVNLLNSDIKTSLYSGLSNNDITKNLSHCEYLVAMRFHAIIIGLLTNTKTLSINYDIKVEKISQEFNLPMIDLKKDFKSQFKDLKSQDLKEISEKVQNKTFKWDGFDRAINL